MKKYNIVIEPNVMLSALRSNKGASYKLISLLPKNLFTIKLSVPLILEYESILIREIKNLNLNNKDIGFFIDTICKIGKKYKITYLWRPFLKDPKDDFILELAYTSESDFIITFNKDDFSGATDFGIEVITPKEFLKLLEKSK